MLLTEDELFDIISKEAIVDRDKVTRDANLEDLGVSSVDLMSCLFEVEERFGVVIDQEQVPRTSNLGELVDFLLAKVNEGKTA